MMRELRVLAGPARLARRYAERQGWPEESYLIITRGHQLARLDPARVTVIVMVKLAQLGKTIAEEITEEVALIKALWSVPTTVSIG